MCGLAGIVKTAGIPEIPGLELASAALRHRGPDSSGFMLRRRCALVHRRLSILDLSAAGSQPMRADSLPVWIAYNGEIYNYRSLRNDLKGRGWRFVSDGDTEVVLKAYIEWGPEALARLRGMYALAIWDERDNTLLLARDPFGIKPLYYAHLDDGSLVFGSEIKAVQAFPAVPDELHYTALAQYLRYHYIPEPHSIYRHIKRLPAGHCLLWKDGALTIPGFQPPTGRMGGGIDRSSSEEEVTQVLADSVSAHMIADVPVGVFLSGGVDSSLVAALMRRASNAELHSFSIVFADRLKSADESGYARTVARHLQTRHHEVVIDDRVLQRLPETLGFFDEPFANPAALIAARLSEFASEHVKVVLSGVGGDEFFGGYPRYLALSAQRALRLLPAGLCDLAARASGLLPARTDRKWMPDRIVRLLNAGADLPLHFYDDLVAYSTPAQAAAVVNPDIAACVQWRDPKRVFDCRAAGSQALAMEADVASYLPGDLLTYTDRCAMAYSLEVRTPLIDLEVARAARSLPSRRKTRGLQTKWLLKRIAATVVPPEVVYRKKKGFAVPIAEWLRRHPPAITGALSAASCRDLPELNPAGVAALLKRHHQGDNSVAYLLWALFSYVTWRKRLPAAPSKDWEARQAVDG